MGIGWTGCAGCGVSIRSLVVVVLSETGDGSVSVFSLNGVYMYVGKVSCVFNKSRLFLRYVFPRDCTINDLGAYDFSVTCPGSHCFSRLILTFSPTLIGGKVLALLS